MRWLASLPRLGDCRIQKRHEEACQDWLWAAEHMRTGSFTVAFGGHVLCHLRQEQIKLKSDFSILIKGFPMKRETDHVATSSPASLSLQSLQALSPAWYLSGGRTV